MCLLLTELRGVVNQRFSPLVVLEDLNTCPARLRHNKKTERHAQADIPLPSPQP